MVVKIFEDHCDSLVLFGRNLGFKSVEVEDSIQDLFLKFCENEVLIINARNREAYLKISLKRHLLRKYAQDRRTIEHSSKVLEISVPSYEEQLIKKQTSLQDAIAVKEALSCLSKSQKTIMTMRFYRSMSYEDIAGKLGIKKRTVYNQVHDAMKKMRSAMSNQ